MSWISDYKYRWYEKFAINVIKAGGRIPKHIAFIMDGNRRFAKAEGISKIKGHSKGFDKLADCLRWCLDMNIQEVTTFAFSIENFKRSEEEINNLFDLAREKFNKLLQDKAKLDEYGVRIRVIGNLSLLPIDLQRLMATVVIDTEQNNRLFLNIAFPYTSHDEISQAMEVIIRQGDNLKEEDISERLLDECMYTRGSSQPDLILRTSGETRMSDFLMWQMTCSVLYFTKVLWPQITLWTFLAAIFYYQRTSRHLERFKKLHQAEQTRIAETSNLYSERVQTFLQRLDESRRNFLLKLKNNTE